jgi:hypothetical protein
MAAKRSLIDGNRMVEILEKNPEASFAGLSSIFTSILLNQTRTESHPNEISAYLSGLSGAETSLISKQLLCYVTADQEDISRLNSQLVQIRKNPHAYPFEWVAELSITDRSGHRRLMDKTWEGEILEWGTFLKSKLDPRGKLQNSKAISYEVLAPEEALASGWISDRKPMSVRVHGLEASKFGYNSYHHYHPGIQEAKEVHNYFNNMRDKSCFSSNSINYITFNRTDGPEIIGYNKQFFYIPDTPEKDHLVRAGPKEIVKYLESVCL